MSSSDVIIIECELCNEPYEDTGESSGTECRIPRLLSCGHTFCQSCLSSWASQASSVVSSDHASVTIECPLCRLPTTLIATAGSVPNTVHISISQLPKNYDLLKVAAEIKSVSVTSTETLSQVKEALAMQIEDFNSRRAVALLPSTTKQKELSFEIEKVLPASWTITYTRYSIKCSDETRVYRRYSDFIFFQDALRRANPCRIIPALPEKTTVGTSITSASLLCTRLEGLQAFIYNVRQDLMTKDNNSSSEVVQKFFTASTEDWQHYMTRAKTEEEFPNSKKLVFDWSKTTSQCKISEADFLKFKDLLEKVVIAGRHVESIRSNCSSILNTVIPMFYKEIESTEEHVEDFDKTFGIVFAVQCQLSMTVSALEQFKTFDAEKETVAAALGKPMTSSASFDDDDGFIDIQTNKNENMSPTVAEVRERVKREGAITGVSSWWNNKSRTLLSALVSGAEKERERVVAEKKRWEELRKKLM